MSTNAETLLSARIIPRVADLKLISETLFSLEDGARFAVGGGDIEDIVKDARRFWNITPEVKTLPPDASLKPEAYGIEINASEVTITASARAGVRHAMKTLRQLAEVERGVLRSHRYFLPSVQIKDEPVLEFRGIHLCWFPETPVWEIEKQIRLAAYYKFNHVILESWGVIKLKSHPEYVWNEFAVEQDEVTRLVNLAKELGITLSPQVNLFGHATASRVGSGKHVLLDFYPEYAPLFEPDGWTWCISNPATRQYLEDIVTEIHALFDNPPIFHIGCDEAYTAGYCSSCAGKDYRRLLKDHLLYFYELLKQRGARILMWHDMLIAHDDERWKNYTACGRSAFRLDTLYQELPRDVLICDWQYGYPEIDGHPPEWPTLKFFKESGFEVVACPWLNVQGTASLGELAAREGLLGMLGTAWHLNHAHDLYRIFFADANASWSVFRKGSIRNDSFVFFNRHLREIGYDMNVTKYIQTGLVQYQINPHTHQNS